MLRYIIHVIGDIHQPLHASSLFSKEFLKGDEGGNLFEIRYKRGIDNLHKLFDSGFDLIDNKIERPLTEADSDYLTKTAHAIIDENKKEKLIEFQSKEMSDWLRESHDISEAFIYKGMYFV